MIISIISAVAENRVIGNKNSLPWHLPADFKYFKKKTLNKTIVMGLNTFKSIGEKPLPNRKHIILSKDTDYKVPENCFLATSIEHALDIAKSLAADPGQSDEIMICGGASVYKQFLPLTDKLYLTYIHQKFEGDTFFPEFDTNEWQEVSREDHEPDDLPAPRPNIFFVYALLCNNNSIYIGHTEDLDQRFKDHCNGIGAEHTKKYEPKYIVHYEEYPSKEEAVAREKWLKTGFGRKWLRREIKSGRARQAGKNKYKYSFVVLEKK